MPIYPCKCAKCGPVEVHERAANHDKLKCPECSSPVEQDYAAKIGTLGVKQDTLSTRPVGRQEVHGRLIDYDCHPSEVKERREALAPFGLSHMYDDKGRCTGSSRSELRKFGKARGTMLRRKKDGVKDKRLSGWD